MIYINPKRQLDFNAGGVVIALSIIFVLGIAVRLSYLNLLGGVDYLAATEHYYGGIISFYLQAGDTLFQSGTYTSLARPPGYPIFVGFWRNLGLDITGLRTVQAGIDACTSIVLYVLLRRTNLSAWLALLGALAYAIYPLWSIGSVLILAEALSPTFIVWIIATLLWASTSTSPITWLLPGATIGIAALFRPDFILLIFPAGLWLLWQRLPWRKVLPAVLALGLGFSIFIGSWGLHNLNQHGMFTITSTSGGYGLWAGLGELPNEYGYFLSDARAIDLVKSMGMEWHSIEADDYFANEYLRAWREHPEYVLKVIWHRWKQITMSQERPFKFFYLPTRMRSMVWLDLLDQYGLVFLFAAVAISYRFPSRLLVVLLPLGTALFTIGLVHYEARYVRYVPLSYIVAISICLEFTYHQVLKFTHHQPRRTIPLRYIESGLILAIIFYSSYELYNEWHQWRAAKARVELVTTLPEIASNGKLVQKYDGKELSWEQFGADVIHKNPDGWLIRTSKGRYLHQIGATIPVSDITAAYIPFSLSLVEGGVYVALRDDSADMTIVQKHFTEPGFYADYLSAYVEGLDTITIVFGNYRSGLGQSEFVISALEVYSLPESPD